MKIVRTLQAHMGSTKTLQHLCNWKPKECPTDFETYGDLKVQVAITIQERVDAEIELWLKDSGIFQEARSNLLEALQSEYLSLNSTLNDIEGHIHKPEPNKGGQQYNLPDDLDSKLFTDIKDMTLQEKITVGVTAPLWVPLAILAAPFVAGVAVYRAIRDGGEEKKYYDGYLSGTHGTFPELMALETRKKINSIMEGQDIHRHINKQMQDLVGKIMELMDQIPCFVKADQQMLVHMEKTYKDGMSVTARKQCIELLPKVINLQDELLSF